MWNNSILEDAIEKCQFVERMEELGDYLVQVGNMILSQAQTVQEVQEHVVARLSDARGDLARLRKLQIEAVLHAASEDD